MDGFINKEGSVCGHKMEENQVGRYVRFIVQVVTFERGEIRPEDPTPDTYGKSIRPFREPR